jgi:hypothetical protein
MKQTILKQKVKFVELRNLVSFRENSSTGETMLEGVEAESQPEKGTLEVLSSFDLITTSSTMQSATECVNVSRVCNFGVLEGWVGGLG